MLFCWLAKSTKRQQKIIINFALKIESENELLCFFNDAFKYLEKNEKTTKLILVKKTHKCCFKIFLKQTKKKSNCLQKNLI